MASPSRRSQALLLLALVAAPLAYAQLSNLPDLSTATQTTKTTSSSSPSSTSSATTAATTDAATTTTDGATTTGSAFHLTGLPTIEGAGIPTLVIPYTADAPFMQKSNLPEGTVFIAVGAVLAFLGACVLLWRGLVAWSINRSVKKAALASLRGGSEKTSTWGGSNGYNPVKNGFYKDTHGSSMSLDALTSTGKPVGKPHFRDHDVKRESTPPPNNLFFSPTAQPSTGVHHGRSNSNMLPAGYYASSNSQAAGGAGATTLGAGGLSPYARHSQAGASPPPSPGLSHGNRNSTAYRAPSREGMRSSYRDSSVARNSYFDSSARQGHTSGLYTQPSSSSLMVGIGGNARQSQDHLGGSRAPSAYLEDLFENHGNGPRERF